MKLKLDITPDIVAATEPILLLVPQVKLPKRRDLDCNAAWALDSVPGLLVANWGEERP